MNFEEFCDFLNQNLKNIDVKVNKDQQKKLYIYMKELLKWNEKINVTAITNENDFVIKHYIDSLSINKYLKNSKKIIDIGTGGGFPGVPLKIINSEKFFTLVDSINKKLNVIRDINKKLNIENMEIIHERAEILSRKDKYKEAYDIAVSRAVSDFSNISKYMLPFLKKGGRAICMKGPNFEEDLIKSEKIIKKFGGEIENIEKINIDNKVERNIIVILKKNVAKNG